MNQSQQKIDGLESIIQKLQDQLNNMKMERQTLELSFRDKIGEMTRRLDQSKRELERVEQEKSEIGVERNQAFQQKVEELELLQNNHEIARSESDMNRRRVEQLEGRE